MTIDERLARLAERHEALAGGVELLLASSRENTGNIGKLAVAQTENEVLMAQVLEAVNSLARIAESHERRLTRLDVGAE